MSRFFFIEQQGGGVEYAILWKGKPFGGEGNECAMEGSLWGKPDYLGAYTTAYEALKKLAMQCMDEDWRDGHIGPHRHTTRLLLVCGDAKWRDAPVDDLPDADPTRVICKVVSVN